MEKITGCEDSPSEGTGTDGLCIREPEDILAFIPHTIGEWPTESLIAVAVGGGSVGVTVRVDLPADGSRVPNAQELGGALRDHLASDVLADSCVLAIFTSQPWTDPCTPPWIDLVTSIGDDLAAAGIPVLDAWLVGSTHWRSMLCSDTSCCPWPGRLIEAIESSRLGAEMVYRGSSFGEPVRRDSRKPDPRRLDPRDQAIGCAGEQGLTDSELWWSAAAFASALAYWEEALSGAPVPPERLFFLASSLTRPALRDAALVAAAVGATTAWTASVEVGAVDPAELASQPEPSDLPGAASHRVREAVRGWLAGERSGGGGAGTAAALTYGAVLLGGTRERPDWGRIGRFERLLRQMSELEEPEMRAPALALLGWISWVRGRGSRAAAYLRRALSAVPGYRFAELFARIVDSGEVAGWARRPETAWRPVGEAA
ncbi:DUF4192 family protein [Sinomonas gamaensis]|uniref:DUF4192 family protein n=1 Tax=Sinomonas gamaensis TaxID=2565624 RepID=UPI0011085226|nr:DUF4192 family protein [Sinomonas gamaensis]